VSYHPIEDYGLIGNMETCALVSLDGSIDLMCFPHFDSPSVFAALLDDEEGGHFQIAPSLSGARRKQLYLPDTNILLTRFLSAEGVAELSDFMPVQAEGHACALVRRVKTVRGSVTYALRCAPRFDYARAQHRVAQGDGEALFVSQGRDGEALRLKSDVPLELDGEDATASFTLRTGQTATFVLERALPGAPSASDAPGYAVAAFKDTMTYWERWTAQSTYRGRWRDVIHRSALALKLLTSKAHGSVVAAPTFSLPETLGGERNWDYRYTWIRDASFTMYAFTRLGFTQETQAFMRWIEARCDELNAEGSPLQIMYRLDGGHELGETTLDHLSGYRGSAPVRVGNGAANQLQLDIYGELMDAVYLYNKHAEPLHYDLWANLTTLIDWVCEHWALADEGIWEVRGGRHEFLYSRLMCWVALDRAVRLAHKRSLPAPLARWRDTRDAIYRDIFENFWDAERGAFVQHKDAKTVDASCLLMPLVKFIGPTDPRWLSTLRAVEQDLVDDSLVYRYRVGEAAPDGLRGEEGTFTMCSFWYVECLARAGDLDKARLAFEKALGYANHVGLYAEELGPSGEHLGNFPQAFTHLALVSAAYDLDRRLAARDRARA